MKRQLLVVAPLLFVCTLVCVGCHFEHTWRSEEWQYTIDFPITWIESRAGGQNILSPGLDVYSRSRSGASTAVFAYSFRQSRDLDKLTQEALAGYRVRSGDLSVLETADYMVDGNNYRRIVFRFVDQIAFISYYTIIFTPRMQLVVSQNTAESNYERDISAFAHVVESLKFSEGTGELPIGVSNKWSSNTWGYSIVFPKTWFPAQRDTSQQSGPVDITCNSWWGSSIYVFAYRRNPVESVDTVASSIIRSYQERSECFKLEETRDYVKGTATCRTVIFRWTPKGEHENIGNYTFLLSNSLMLLISCESSSDNYVLDEKDYWDVINSIQLN